MNFNKILIIFWLSITFILSCSSVNTLNTVDGCILFEEKRFWYKDAKKSYDKWNVPISTQLAFINQESSFKQFAKPERKKLIGIIPWKRPSTAFGYAQVIDPTWDWYKKKTGNFNASRANFGDVTDFIGWDINQSKEMIGLEINDTYNQYLAYHEGQNGWKNNSYINKKWLIKAAKNVNNQANEYNLQLINCEKKLNKKGIFGIL